MGAKEKLTAKLGREPTDEELALYKKSREEKKAKRRGSSSSSKGATPPDTPNDTPSGTPKGADTPETIPEDDTMCFKCKNKRSDFNQKIYDDNHKKIDYAAFLAAGGVDDDSTKQEQQ